MLFRSSMPEVPPIWPSGFRKDIEETLRHSLSEQRVQLERLRRENLVSADTLASAAFYYKSAIWALRYETNISAGDALLIQRAVANGQQRLQNSPEGTEVRQGFQTHAYVSVVDGSVQPYGLVVPKSYSANKPIRLDVVLHGSSKPSEIGRAHV